MSSPNEPGTPATGDASVPAPRQGAHAAPVSDPRIATSGAPATPSSTLDERLNRFANVSSARDADTTITPAITPSSTPPVITGTAAPQPPAVPSPTTTARVETSRPESYASELPDLSSPRTAQRRPVERENRESSAPARKATAATRTPAGKGQQGPVRASMQVRRFDPWSVLKVSLVLSAALFFVWMIAVAFLYLVLGGMGVWSKLNSNVGDLLTNGGGGGGELVSSGTIFGGAALIGLVNIVLLTAMATASAFIYNLTTDLVGGIEVTLADRD